MIGRPLGPARLPILVSGSRGLAKFAMDPCHKPINCSRNGAVFELRRQASASHFMVTSSQRERPVGNEDAIMWAGDLL